MNEWRINRPEQRCVRCERAFVEGEAVFSVLSFDSGSLKREDRCANCFEAPGAEGEPLFFWRTRHTLDRRARFAVDFQAIEELFLGLEGERRTERQELRYLLALLLLRKKRLKLVGVRRQSSGESLCLRRPRRQEEFEVQVFELDSARAAALQAELARVFEGAGVDGIRGAAVDPAAESGAPATEAPARD